MFPRAFALAALVLALAACGGGSKPLARVGDQQVTAEQVDSLVSEAVAELRREGKDVPAEETPSRRALERRALAILVRRARLEQKAEDLGVTVSEDEVAQRIGAGSGAQAEQEADTTFVAGQARAQLLYEKLFAAVTAKIVVTDAEVRAHYERNRSLYAGQSFASVREGIRSQLLGERRNAAMTRWLAAVTRELPARYDG